MSVARPFAAAQLHLAVDAVSIAAHGAVAALRPVARDDDSNRIGTARGARGAALAALAVTAAEAHVAAAALRADRSAAVGVRLVAVLDAVVTLRG